MAILTQAVATAPVDAGAALGLDGDHVFENLGPRPLRFVVAAAAGEPAPLDLRAGHLLLPGQRETVRTASGVPVWAWSDYPTRLGVGPAWQVAPGGGGAPAAGGGGLSLVHAGESATGALNGAHDAGDARLIVADASIFDLGRVQVGGELHTIEAVDETANAITIEAAGLTAGWADDTAVVQAPIIGTGDVLQLAGGPFAEIDARMLYDLPQFNGNAPFYNGRSSGAYYAGGAGGGAWYESLANYGSWFAGGQQEAYSDPAGTWGVGIVHATANAASSIWVLVFDPARSTLALSALDGAQELFIPRVYSLIVAGRRA